MVMLLVLSSLINHAKAQVRGTEWGSSYSDVEKTINNESFNALDEMFLEMLDLSEIEYTSRIKAYPTFQLTGGEESVVAYVFLDDRLARIMVNFTSPNYTFEEFETIAARLEQKYGEPETEDWVWYDEDWKESNDYGFAIRMGKVGITYYWDIEDTYIELSTGNDGTGEVSFTISYLSNELYDEFDAALLDDF